jgi:3-phenylpropionate/trans-cinnamate dioxygenase ferredoxin reductase component
VTMLETASQPFGALLGQEVGELLAGRYRDAGVDVRTGAHASAFRAGHDGRVGAVLLADGTEIGCDVVLLAVGVEPAAELLPSQPDRRVFACGDVTGGGHWTSAAAGATGTARAILGLDPPPRQPPFVWSDQFGLRLQLVGEPRGAARVELEGGDEEFVARYLAADGRLVAALAANRPHEVGSIRRELALAA